MGPRNLPNVVDGVNFGRQSTMHAEILTVHDRGEGQAIEALHASVVDLLSILDEAFGLEGKILAQMPTFVVTPDQMDRVTIKQFQRPEVENDLDAEIPAIHVIAEKKITGFVRLTTNFEELYQVVELPMNITANGDGSGNLQHILLFVEQSRRLVYNAQCHLLSDAAFAYEVLLQGIGPRLTAMVVDLCHG